MVGDGMKALHKDFWMEIRKSKARFISIFLIVALGVAFFSGIQASSPDMRYSGDAYYEAAKLMDLKIQGTLGLTECDVKAVSDIDGVELAEGGYSTDVMSGEDDAGRFFIWNPSAAILICSQQMKEGYRKKAARFFWTSHLQRIGAIKSGIPYLSVRMETVSF